MVSLFLNFNLLRSQAQVKGWSNRPEVPLVSRWQRKKPKPAPITTTTAPGSRIKTTPTTTTNVLLLHPICRCCADVVNSVIMRRPSKQPEVSKVTTPSSSGRKPTTWDGLPSTQYMRLWPVMDEEKLREARFTADRFTSFGLSPTTSPEHTTPMKKKKKKHGWKFWQSLL